MGRRGQNCARHIDYVYAVSEQLAAGRLVKYPHAILLYVAVDEKQIQALNQ